METIVECGRSWGRREGFLAGKTGGKRDIAPLGRSRLSIAELNSPPPGKTSPGLTTLVILLRLSALNTPSPVATVLNTR